MKEFLNITTDEERALYGVSDALVKKCVFAGEADGESALKETSSLTVDGCEFRLRYPMWHMSKSEVSAKSFNYSTYLLILKLIKVYQRKCQQS